MVFLDGGKLKTGELNCLACEHTITWIHSGNEISCRNKWPNPFSDNLLPRRQRGPVVRAPDLKSIGCGFKSRFDERIIKKVEKISLNTFWLRWINSGNCDFFELMISFFVTLNLFSHSFWQTMNLNSAQIGLVFLVPAITFAIVSPLAGWVGDKTVC